MKQVVAIMLALAASASAAMIYTETVRVAGGGFGYEDCCNPSDDRWNLSFGGASATVAVSVSASGQIGYGASAFTSSNPNVCCRAPRGYAIVSDIFGNTFESAAFGYSLTGEVSTLVLADPNNEAVLLVSVPILGFYERRFEGNATSGRYFISVVTPEPAAWQLLGLGLAGLVLVKRSRRD